MNHLILGFAGRAGVGKDTLFSLLEEHFSAKYIIRRFSIGDIVRHHLNVLPYLTLSGVNFFNLQGEQKEKWRPLMVAYANACRRETNGRYFIDSLTPCIKNFDNLQADKPCITCITDIRFDEFEKDEIVWLQQELNGYLVYINRFTVGINGEERPIPFVNETERSQDSKLKQKANFHISWPTISNKNILLNYAGALITEIEQNWMPLQGNLC